MTVMPVVRRLLARRPWVQWAAIVAIAVGAAASVADAMSELAAERAAWGTAATVWVATEDLEVGDRIAAEAVSVPAAVRPAGAVDDPEGAVARQAIGRGEVVARYDVMAPGDELALTPAGWLVAPVEEAPRSGAALGERVQVASEGFVVADEAVVVGTLDDITLVAVPPDVAPLLPAATRITLLRAP